METHAHHLHKAPGKKIWHYFFEFVMLFLAVFCGFLAENIREHQIEENKEKEFISSMISDLKDDIKTFDAQEQIIEQGIVNLDSLFYLLDNPELAKKNGSQLYYLARLAPRMGSIVNNNRTFEQLKNSGGFRLIKKIEASNKIMSYYSKFPLMRLLEEIYAKENQSYKTLAAKIFDPGIFRKLEMPDGGVIRSNENPSLRSYDSELLKELGVFTVYMNGTRRGLLPLLIDIHKSADELIAYLEKEYPAE